MERSRVPWSEVGWSEWTGKWRKMEKELESKRMLGVHLLPDIRQGMPCFTLATCTYDRSPKSLHVHIQFNFFCVYIRWPCPRTVKEYICFALSTVLLSSIRFSFSAQELICTSSTAQGGGGSFKNRKPIGEGWLLRITDGRANPPSFSPFLYLYDYLPTYLPILSLSLYLTCLSLYLSICLSI